MTVGKQKQYTKLYLTDEKSFHVDITGTGTSFHLSDELFLFVMLSISQTEVSFELFLSYCGSSLERSMK